MNINDLILLSRFLSEKEENLDANPVSKIAAITGSVCLNYNTKTNGKSTRTSRSFPVEELLSFIKKNKSK